MTKKKELLIVESPTKARTIFRLLGQKMRVMSTIGHISDLPKSKLGVDIEHGFEPEYIRIRGKAPVIKELQKAAKEASVVYLACDPDREGEAIAYSVANEIAVKKEGTKGATDKGKKKKATRGAADKTTGPVVKRVLFYEITRQGLEKAFSEPGALDLNKVNSHRGRRVLDRLVGYLVSPVLWKVVRVGLSAGRVQTVALRILVEREREILAFKTEEYWIIKAAFYPTDLGHDPNSPDGIGSCPRPSFSTQLVRIAGKKARLDNRAQVETVEKECRAADFRISSLKSRTRKRSPLPPFTTATLQQDAVQRLGLPARRTMQLAQQLFEGVEIDGEPTGLITYPRTDSVRVAETVIADARDYIGRSLGTEYLPDAPRHYREKKDAQGAHEAIRPTRADRAPETLQAHLNRDQFRLYDLIFRRFLASQMTDAEYSVTEVVVTDGEAVGGRALGAEKRKEESSVSEGLPAQSAGGKYEFWAEAVKNKFAGFERVYGDREKETALPELTAGEPVTMKEFSPEQKFTQPPPRYTEATLIKKLETNGIGRPSTYASIVSTLFDRKYVERKERKLAPTELGMIVHDVLIPNFSNVFETGFTREMEKELDMVEEGKEKWQNVVEQFYRPLKEDLDRVGSETGEMKQGLQKLLDEKCPECGKPLAERWGRFGKFVACSTYPECKYVKKDKPKLLSETCPQCGKPLVQRTGRFGDFIACSGYPECKYVKRDAKPGLKVGDPCPQCGKPLVEKQGRFGAFVACPGYPECKFMVRAPKAPPKTLDEKCPQCGKPLVERKGRFGPFVACSGYPGCKYIKKDKKAKPGAK